MWESRDIALIIVLAVSSFIYSFFVGQLGNLITGILGLNYLFVFGHAIFISFGFLIYEGRRWRFLLQSILVVLLTLPTHQSGAPYDVLARMPLIIGAFFSDLIFNSIYKTFRKHNKLIWWAIIVAVVFLLIIPFFIALNMLLFYAPEVFTLYVNVYLLLFPVTMIEAIIGGFIGYRIYERIKKPSQTKHSDLKSTLEKI